MKIQKFSVALLFLFLFPILVWSQSRLSDEFTKSTIRYKDGTVAFEQVNPFLLFVKARVQTETKSVSASDVDWIELDSIKYFFKKISNLRNDSLKTVEAITIGTLSLYRSARQSERSDIIVEKNTISYVLRIIRSPKWDSPNQVREIKEYLSVLTGLTNDCVSMSGLTERTSLDVKQIKKIVEEYNSKCGQQSFTNSRLEKKKFTTSLGFLVGYTYINNPITYGQIPRVGSFTSTRPFVGFFVRRNFGRFSKYSLENELIYEQIKGQSFTSTRPGYPVLLFEQIRYDLSQLRNQFGIDYKFFSRKFDLFLGIGVSLKYQLQNKTAIDYYYGQPGFFSESITNKTSLTFSPSFTLRASIGNVDVRYRTIPFTTNIPDFEDIAFEHRFSVGYVLFRSK